MCSGENYLRFIPGYVIDDSNLENDLWMIFYKDKMLAKMTGDIGCIPSYMDLVNLNIGNIEGEYIGDIDGVRCYTLELEEFQEFEGFEFKDLRYYLGILEEQIFLVCGRAFQIINWRRNNKYCGRCGSLTVKKADERAKECKNCGAVVYPSVAPAIIVAIIKDNKILLAHNRSFPSRRYSCVAGFLEYGETLENCVKREVMEEVGIKVKNIKYVENQPWPFPNSLMVAFIAEYDSGEIKVDGVEIDDAKWFSVDELPNIPGKGSVASKLIGWFVENFR